MSEVEPVLTVEEKAAYLKRARPFAVLDAASLHGLAERAGERDLEAGEVAVEEGEPGDTLYVVCEGRVEVAKTDGDDLVVLASLGPGQFFGEMAPLSGRARAATVRAAVPSRIVFVRGKALRLLIQQSPDVAFAILGDMAERLDAATEVIVDFVSASPTVALLAVEAGPDEGRVFLIRRRRVTLGRATGSVIGDLYRCALHEDEEAVAIDHARIVLEGDRYYLIPLGGELATCLNATPTAETVELRSGDRIGLGGSVLRFETAPEGD